MKNTSEYRNQVSQVVDTALAVFIMGISLLFLASGAMSLILMMLDMHNIALFNPVHPSDGMIFAAMTILGGVLLKKD